MYQIHLQGHLDTRWMEWFEEFDIHYLKNGTTLLTGDICDQSALHGQLAKIRDLGLVILSVQVLPHHAAP